MTATALGSTVVYQQGHPADHRSPTVQKEVTDHRPAADAGLEWKEGKWFEKRGYWIEGAAADTQKDLFRSGKSEQEVSMALLKASHRPTPRMLPHR